MVQRLLIESFENTGKVGSVAPSAVGLRADYTLTTDLREFQAELPPGADTAEGATTPVTAHVRLNVKIVQQPQGLIIGSRSFERKRKAASNNMPDVAAAFDRALGGTMKHAVEWTIRSIAKRETGTRGVRAPGF